MLGYAKREGSCRRDTMAFSTYIPVADPDLQIRRGRGDGHPDPEIRGRPASKKNFSALRASFSSKNKAIAGGPGLLPWIRHCIPTLKSNHNYNLSIRSDSTSEAL